MTKTQVKAKLRKLLEQLGDVRAELDDLKCEVEETSESIEPYDTYNDLTPEQEERQEWMDNVASELDTLIDSIDTYELEGIAEE